MKRRKENLNPVSRVNTLNPHGSHGYLLTPAKRCPVPQAHPTAPRPDLPFQQLLSKFKSSSAAPGSVWLWYRLVSGPSQSLSLNSQFAVTVILCVSHWFHPARTWENIYLKQKTLFGCIFKQKINQQNIVSALLKKHLKGNPETSLQYFCFHKVVVEDRKPHKHHYAPIFMNSVRSHAGQGGPSSTGPPDLVTIHQQLMGANMTSLHSSVLPPNPKTPTPQSKLFPLPSR